MNSITNSPEAEKYQPIVFVNNPITNAEGDVIGFETQVDTLQCAIDNGANMIGIIADYGSGKSSMAEMLSLSEQKKGNPPPIKINMWDCLSNINNTNKISENVSMLTKSFLYQLSNGHSSKLGKYVNKILSKNYGSIALAINDSKRFWIWFVIAGICYTIYQIANVSGTGIMKHLPQCCDIIASGLKLSAPIFAFAAIITIILGLKDAYIAFSHWNMANRREPEINDVFDTYNIIIEKIKPEDEKKQLIFIDDLDRINKKKLIVEFLKELYRFQDSLGKDKDKFVFIISIKPESELKEIDDNVEVDEVYSKIFDLTLSLKPIHFDDYDSILLKLLKNNPEQKKNLEKLIDQDIQDILPESFRWIKRGTNLTLRDLKDRLNQAISIMISLKNKDYKVKTAVNFEACAAVAYLENKYPKDYYNLIKLETELATFLQNSREIIDKTIEDKKLEDVRIIFTETFVEEKTEVAFKDFFINDLCEMVLDKLFNDDFRMYFYTYPKGSHIKTTDERTLCNYILFPNSFSNYENLDEAVKRAFEPGENLIVKQTIKSLEDFPPVLIENDALFLLSVKTSIEKTFVAFAKKVINSDYDEEYKANYWKRTLILSKSNYDSFVQRAVNHILFPDPEPNAVIANRKAIIKGIGNKILDYKRVYIHPSYKTPQITEDEIILINNVDISLQLVDVNNLKEENYNYLIPLINEKPLNYSNIFELALKIWIKSSDFFLPDDIGEELLQFLKLNQYIDDDLFELVSKSSVKKEEIAQYLNEPFPKNFSKKYLEIIDSLGFESDISQDILIKLLECHLYFTPLLYCAYNNRFSIIDSHISNVESILKACEEINSNNKNAIVRIRNYLCNEKNINEYMALYNAPFPIITLEEYNGNMDKIKAIKLIDVSQITEENYISIIDMIHYSECSPAELVTLVKWIFDKSTNEKCLTDAALRKDFFDNLDLNLLGMKKLSEDQRNELYTILKDEFAIANGDDAIESLRQIGCLIPKVEEFIQKYNSYTDEYCNLFSQLDEMTTTTIKWCEEHYISCGLSAHLCDLLYEKADYQNYIIGETLRQKYLKINYNIDFQNYINVYKYVEVMFDVMSEHWDFLEKLQDECDLETMDEDKLIPIFRVKQTERFFNHIFSDKTTDELKNQYLYEFGSFREEKDSRAFQKLICQKDNIELLGSWDLYHRIRNLLWESHPGHKGAFTRAWNKRWKDELS